MAILIFRLNGVEQAEADEVRQLLLDEGLDCYETTAGRWGLSVAGIWLKDESRVASARRLLGDYAHQRQQRLRGEYLQARSRGELPPLWRRISGAPLRYLAIALLLAAVLYLSIGPFIDMGR
jgi:hypothetical protein